MKRLSRTQLLYLVVFTLVFTPPLAICMLNKHWDAQRTLLLYNTDHQKLLCACRQYMENNRDLGKIYRVKYRNLRGSRRLPDEILDLKPAYIVVEPFIGEPANIAALEICMTRGPEPYIALKAYSEGYPETIRGDRKIIDGLWYRDGGFHDYDGWEEHLLSLAPKNVDRNDILKEVPK